jgi:hypothetical protein
MQNEVMPQKSGGDHRSEHQQAWSAGVRDEHVRGSERNPQDEGDQQRALTGQQAAEIALTTQVAPCGAPEDTCTSPTLR